MQSIPLLICGAGGHGKVVADIVERQGQYRIVGFLDDQESSRGTLVGGHSVLGCIRDFLSNGHPHHLLILAIGSNRDRERLAREAEAARWQFACAIHPSAQIGSDVVIGPGTVIMPNAVVNTGTRIGAHVIINTGATVDHDCTIGDFAHVAPGANLAGAVTVGRGALIGIGACAIPEVTIGCWTTVGAGATVIRDLPDEVTAVGTPAVPIRFAMPNRFAESRR